ncbi:MAG: hypothetical protein ACK5Q5_00320 [Planctomycetaceae bacterium]
MQLTSLGIHPALRLALRFQSRSRWRRIGQSFATPRRIALSLVAVLLACVWLGNVVLSLLFREPYGAVALESWTRVGLTVYALWHLIRTAWERPEQGLAWIPSEEQFLVSGPFTRRQLVQYRLLIVATSAVVKSTIACLLLLPDLQHPTVSLLALFLALYTVELLRIGLDTVTAGMSEKEYTIYRGLVLSGCAAVAVWLFRDALSRWGSVASSDLPVMVSLVSILRESVQALAQTRVFQGISSGFGWYAGALVAPQLDGILAARILGAIGATGLLMEIVLRLDAGCQRRLVQQETHSLGLASRSVAEESEQLSGRLPRVYLGAVTWRQFRGMRLHLTGVLLALVAPAMLSFLPFVMLSQEPSAAFTNFVASLAFYTLLLLPPALKFDFRRDYDRLLALKMLPASPLQITLGQIAVPVLVSTVFQWTMVLLAFLARPVDPGHALAAMCFFIPANLAIFGVDNLLFLLFPHRLQQEGLDVFLRTTLVFTAKGLIFALLLVGVVLWAAAARSLSVALLASGLDWCGPMTLFGVGIWGLTALTATGTILLAASAFRHFDPSHGSVA